MPLMYFVILCFVFHSFVMLVADFMVVSLLYPVGSVKEHNKNTRKQTAIIGRNCQSEYCMGHGKSHV